MQNGFIESFNVRLRDELLNETLFSTLHQAHMALAIWCAEFNNSRPHSQLGWRTPTELAKTFPRRGTALRNPTGSTPSPAATPALRGKSNRPNELQSE